MDEIQDFPEPLSSPRKLFLQLRLMILRQSARRMYDLLQLGSGIAERLCAAIMLGFVFFVGSLTISATNDVPVTNGLILAASALLAVLVPSLFLILGPPDEDIETHIPLVAARLAEARQVAKARKAEAAKQAEAEAQSSPLRVEKLELEPLDRHDPGLPPIRESREVPVLYLEPVRSSRRRCPYCAELVLAQAIKCKHCGEMLEESSPSRRHRKIPVEAARSPRWNPGIAAVLSFLFPGLGQLYKGQILNGLLWMIVVFFGYLFCCLAPGVMMHFFCIIGAASGDPYR